MKPMTWRELQKVLMNAKTEKEVLAILEEEQKNRIPRKRWIQRIFHRYRRLRSKNELKQLNMTGRQKTARDGRKG